MASTNEQLRELFPSGQLQALDRVRQELLDNPEALDTHSKRKEKGDGKDSQTA